MRIDANTPYNDLPLLPPQEELETKEVLKKVISAGRALAELKGLGETIPDQNILINSIILQEAKASGIRPFDILLTLPLCYSKMKAMQASQAFGGYYGYHNHTQFRRLDKATLESAGRLA